MSLTNLFAPVKYSFMQIVLTLCGGEKKGVKKEIKMGIFKFCVTIP
jgi:hypothetical protein